MRLTNPFKTAIAAKQPQIGLWQALGNACCVEVCAAAGFHWLLLDAEHGPNDVRSVLGQLQSAAAYPVHCVVRPPVGHEHLIKQYLDIGATTLLIPMIETAEQAQNIVRAALYPPAGIRGVGAAIARASRWGRIEDYLAEAEKATCVLVQVETVRGLENLEAIAAVPGIDGVFIGPADLAASMGHLGQAGHPEVVAAVGSAIRAVAASGKAPGVLTADETLAREYLELGCLFVAVGTDAGILARGADALARKYITL